MEPQARLGWWAKTMEMNPYLSFNGQCEAAFTFYAQCLGGQL